MVEVGRGEHLVHVVPLLHPDAVLAGEGAARGQRHPDYLLAGRGHPLGGALDPGVVGQDGVQVAVAGVEHVDHADPVAVGDLAHRLYHLHQLAAGHDGVVEVVVGLQVGHRPEGVLAALPQQGPLGLVGRHPHAGRAVGRGDGRHPLGLDLRSGVHAVHLDQQHRGGVPGVPGPHEVLDDGHRPGVHQLHGRRHHAVGYNRADGGRGRGHVGVGGQHGLDRGRVGGEAHGHRGGHPAQALGADEGAPQVVAVRLGLQPAQHHRLAVGEHHLHRGHMGAGDAVGQAVGAAGVVGHVAADGAGLLAGGVGGEVQAVGGHPPGQFQVDQAGLDPGDAVVEVHLQHRVHGGQ